MEATKREAKEALGGFEEREGSEENQVLKMQSWRFRGYI